MHANGPQNAHSGAEEVCMIKQSYDILKIPDASTVVTDGRPHAFNESFAKLKAMKSDAKSRQ
jgi:hypothetical protein